MDPIDLDPKFYFASIIITFYVVWHMNKKLLEQGISLNQPEGYLHLKKLKL